MRRQLSNQIKIRILLSLSVIAFVVFGLFFVNNVLAITEVQNNSLKIGESIGLPVFISIPSIDLNAPIEKVALASDGTMDVPKNVLNTGWYELGPRPGEIGSAVIAGHVDWINGVDAVFKDLSKLDLGDKIVVQDDKGAIISFVVRETRTYDAGADATDVFISNDGRAHLNIITCDGAWDKNLHQYSKRLIIFADKE